VAHDIKGFVMEVRYVGNHVVKMLRGVDFNQNQRQFRTASSRTYQLRGTMERCRWRRARVFNPTFNPAIPGSRIFHSSNSVGGGFLTNSSVAALVQSGEIGSLANFTSRILFCPTITSVLPESVVAVPKRAGLTTAIHLQRIAGGDPQRTRSGIQFQANYTYSKSLSDALAQRGLDPILDVNNPHIEKARTPFDTTHAFKLNHSIPIPFGEGHRLAHHQVDRSNRRRLDL